MAQIARATTVVEATRLTRTFGERTVLRKLDLSLEEGGRLAVAGPNGCGKTTLLRCLSGAVAPSSGTVRLCGLPPVRHGAKLKCGTAIGDHRSFYARLSARENLTLFARLKVGRWRVESLVAAIEEELGMQDFAPSPVAQCSTGQIQRLALARALVGDPRVLLLDEPTRSMDSEGTSLCWGAIDRRPQVGVVVVTHDLAELERCESRLVLPDTGDAT